VRSDVTLFSFVERLAEGGRYTFSTDDAIAALGVSPVAARAALRRLAAKGRIAQPFRGFHVIVPPEYRRLGSLPPEQFIPQLMVRLREKYYVALLSAAQYHGAAHQRPQRFQVAVAKNRSEVVCGTVEVEFVARKEVARVPTVSFNTPRGPIRVASVEATALDLVGYPRHVGGLDNAATVLAELGEKIDGKLLAKVAKTAPVSWSQRLGHLLDIVGHEDKTETLAAFVRNTAGDVIALVPSESTQHAARSSKWRVDVNADIEVDT
jgi:predicted transcriptional regulator of viral defense system